MQGLCSLTNTPVHCKSKAQNATSHAFAPKAAKPSTGSTPCVALCPPLLTATVGPGPIPASRDSARDAVTLWKVTIHLLMGGKILAYPGKKLIFPIQWLDKQGFCPRRPPSSASSLLKKTEWGFVLWNLTWRTSLQYSSRSLNTGAQDSVSGVPSGSWDELHFPEWTPSSAEKLLFFKISYILMWQWHFPKHTFQRNTPNQRATILKKCFWCTSTYNCPLCFMQTWHHIQSWISLAEAAEIVMGKCQEVLHWHHWDFCHWFQ